MQTCSWADQQLDAFRTGELDAETMSRVEEHLAGCESCRAQFSQLEDLAGRLSRLRQEAPSSIRRSVLERLGDRFGPIETALGTVWVGFNDRGVTLISWASDETDDLEAYYRQRLGRKAARADVPEHLASAVRAAAEGQWTADVPLDIEGLPDFERAVLDRLRTIPRGEVRPYAWLATQAGSPGAVRAVGNIMHRNPIPLLLPCHRVVPSTGGLGNYAYGSDVKRLLLEREGVSADELERLARQRVRYVGSRTTGIYCYPTCRDARRIRAENRVPLTNERAAVDAGFRPCQHCQPLTVAA
jgi:O-6-methylguanine DNA methyltransferase